MAKRIKVGLIYSYNTDWIAGAYYILNLIHALNQQEDAQKPELVILSYTQEEFDSVKATGYPYLLFCQLKKEDFWVSYTLFERVINKFSRLIIKRNSYYREQTNKRFKKKIDILFPATNNVYFSKIKNKLFWIPDFQEHFLPQFFSEEEIQSRKARQQLLVDMAAPIVFSSKDALASFKKIYPDAKSKVFVLPFAVTHPVYAMDAIDSVLKKYEINQPYFFCPNQLWAHKNHKIVLSAAKIIKEKYKKKSLLIVFSGKESDYRNPDFFNEIKQKIVDEGIENEVKFLGFIERTDQLILMRNAISVIQPSLFEGWSTVIEDAKAMNQHVIASHLNVHKEQLINNVTFFDPFNAIELADIMSNYMLKQPEKTSQNYQQNIAQFGKCFVEIAEELVDLNK